MEARLQRYRQKINFILEKLSALPKQPKTAVEIDATLYRLQVAIEATIDIVAMLVKDKGYTVSDDYHNLQQLAELKVIPAALAEELKKLNSMRNAIVHKYNRFEAETVIKSKENTREVVVKFLRNTEHELKTIFKPAQKRDH